MINSTNELPQNTTVIQTEQTEQYSKSSNEQHHLEAAFDICGAACSCDLLGNLVRPVSSERTGC